VIQQHQRRVHQWTNPQTRGGDNRPQRKPRSLLWAVDEPCQQSFQRGKWQRHFAVEVQGESRPGVASSMAGQSSRMQARQLLQEMSQRQAGHEREKEIEGTRSRTVAKSWLYSVQWPQHLDRFRPDDLIAIIRPAGGEEDEAIDPEQDNEEDRVPAGLAEACKVTRRLIGRRSKYADLLSSVE